MGTKAHRQATPGSIQLWPTKAGWINSLPEICENRR